MSPEKERDMETPKKSQGGYQNNGNTITHLDFRHALRGADGLRSPLHRPGWRTCQGSAHELDITTGKTEERSPPDNYRA
ncbi:MAG: hypothetical protein ACP5DY_07010, partial [Thermovirgaceae bacterium]